MLDIARRDFFEVVGSRRSIRYFKPWKPVEPEKLEAILQAARIASHMGNVNAVQAIVFTDKELKEKLKPVVSTFNVAFIEMAPVILIWFIERDAWYKEIADHLTDLYKWGAVNPSHGWSVEFIQNSAKPRLTSFPTEVVDFMLSCESGMAMAQAQLTAVALGLGVCSFAGVGPKIAEIFGLPDHCRFVWGMAIGYPAEDPLTGGQRKRKPFEQIYFKDKYGVPFKSDPKAVEMLKELKMLQPEASLTPERLQEINMLSRMAGLPERTD
ncbi:MAG TPA: nitroreductase family protein [Thermodesulfobacteriota bacterium]|jgi:nitroreductase|nr:nitroreductase family protein [Thermodesulfobacteriota bacterium]